MDVLKDSRLSLRAKGLYLMYQSLGEVKPATEMAKIVSEGRDAIRTAMSELTQYGYIETVRYQTAYGHWNVLHRFTEAWKTGDGFSGDLDSCAANIANSSITIAVIPNGITSIVSGDPNEFLEEEEMNRWEEDEPTGAIGKLPEDKSVMRQQKYGAKPSTKRDRFDYPESEWNTNDLLAEFYDLVYKHARGVPSQVNGKSLASWINKQVGTYQTPRETILKAIRAFFTDPRNLRDLGIGHPLWRRFLIYYPTVFGIMNRPTLVTEDYESDRTDKMLKLLEG